MFCVGNSYTSYEAESNPPCVPLRGADIYCEAKSCYLLLFRFLTWFVP